MKLSALSAERGSSKTKTKIQNPNPQSANSRIRIDRRAQLHTALRAQEPCPGLSVTVPVDLFRLGVVLRY